MYGKVTKTVAGANSSSAMEQRPFQKRVSAKNHKSKKMTKNVFWMALISLVMMMSSTMLTSCSGDDDGISIKQKENGIINK